MAKCAICEKGAHFGNNVSHSHRRSSKMWKSNVKSVRVKTENGGTQKMYVCTSCLKSGRVERAYTMSQIRSCPDLCSHKNLIRSVFGECTTVNC